MRRGGPGQEGGQGMMQRGGPGPGMEIGRKPFLNPQRLKEAGATEQQLAALKAFANEQQLKQVDLRATAEKAELALEQLMSNETVDEKAALKAVDALSQARAEIFKLEVSSKLKMKEILGAEVQKKLREMGPPEGMQRQGRGPQAEGRQPRKDAPPPPAGTPPQPQEQK
jgi:Spy/CpxP family protein refolding chaperone